ncbi:unnamed protein product [Lepeophtheirus salmonis]|uniref:(salmon louse) hypothetical protein n=1 Tax=Lepeophtheirus salmonis TaxID=72036 RepID=A0A7R8CS46_LEPSM|nr:unnamed protein product [Lepeophtheirus salmonis]CAF2873887.1 unnamed protein product [Lepeophtheirus salmonis]
MYHGIFEKYTQFSLYYGTQSHLRLHGIGLLLILQSKNSSLTVTSNTSSLLSLHPDSKLIQAVKKCKFLLQEINSFSAIVNHRPLMGLFQKDVYKIKNPRLMRLEEKLLGYNIKIIWMSGKKNLAVELPSKPVLEEYEDGLMCLAVSNPQYLYEAINEPYRQIIATLRAGSHPQCLQESHPSRQFSSMWDDLSLLKIDSVSSDTLITYQRSSSSCRTTLFSKENSYSPSKSTSRNNQN